MAKAYELSDTDPYPVERPAVISAGRRAAISPEQRAILRAARPASIAAEAGPPDIRDDGDVETLQHLDETTARVWHASTDTDGRLPSIDTGELTEVRQIVRKALAQAGLTPHNVS